MVEDIDSLLSVIVRMRPALCDVYIYRSSDIVSSVMPRPRVAQNASIHSESHNSWKETPPGMCGASSRALPVNIMPDTIPGHRHGPRETGSMRKRESHKPQNKKAPWRARKREVITVSVRMSWLKCPDIQLLRKRTSLAVAAEFPNSTFAPTSIGACDGTNFSPHQCIRIPSCVHSLIYNPHAWNTPK